MPKIGPSTIAFLVGIALAVSGYIVSWAESGDPAQAWWLAVVAAGLKVVMGLLRSWQARHLPPDTAKK